MVVMRRPARVMQTSLCTAATVKTVRPVGYGASQCADCPSHSSHIPRGRPAESLITPPALWCRTAGPHIPPRRDRQRATCVCIRGAPRLSGFVRAMHNSQDSYIYPASRFTHSAFAAQLTIRFIPSHSEHWLRDLDCTKQCIAWEQLEPKRGEEPALPRTAKHIKGSIGTADGK